MKEPLPKIYAYVMPLPEQIISRILEENKRTLVKFFSWPRLGTRIQTGTKIVLYKTKSGGELIGEALVTQAALMLPQKVITNHADSLVMTQKEFKSYTDRYPGRQEKEVLVAIIADPVVYQSPLRWNHHMMMAGYFLDHQEYQNRVIQNNFL